MLILTEADKISKIEFTEKAILLIHVEIGNMPPHKIKGYMEDLKNDLNLKESFPHNKILFATMKAGIPCVTISVLEPTK